MESNDASKSGTHLKTSDLVLCVEDAPDLRDLYGVYLRKAGFRVATAANGVEGVERAIELQPALILMDLGMPMVDGLEASRRLKKHPKTQHIPILVVTAHGHDGPRAEFDGLLAKPVAGSELIAKALELVNAHRATKLG